VNDERGMGGQGDGGMRRKNDAVGLRVSVSPCFRVAPWSLVISIAITMLINGCVNGPDDIIVLPPTDLYHVKVAEAWIELESGRYHDATIGFREASEIDPLSSDAYLGLGWCYAMTDQMEESSSNFEVAIIRDPGSPDGHAAKAFVHLAQNEYAAAIEAADEAISLGGEEYVFSQIPEVRTGNLRLLIAECYYAMGQYADAQAQIDILKPDNNLDQDSRNYKRDLLLEIESLKPVGPIIES
jgi:tetratricopeptide (TPR) repeat protein